jgi:hypothetical protein
MIRVILLHQAPGLERTEVFGKWTQKQRCLWIQQIKMTSAISKGCVALSHPPSAIDTGSHWARFFKIFYFIVVFIKLYIIRDSVITFPYMHLMYRDHINLFFYLLIPLSFFVVTEIWTQGLTLARWVFYLLSHTLNLLLPFLTLPTDVFSIQAFSVMIGADSENG